MFNTLKFKEVIENAGSDLADYIDVSYMISAGAESFDSNDELAEYLQERISEAEIIYYAHAIAYLAEHDASLMESLSLASEYGYTTDKLNSELLATLLLQQNLNEALTECDFIECFEFESEKV